MRGQSSCEGRAYWDARPCASAYLAGGGRWLDRHWNGERSTVCTRVAGQRCGHRGRTLLLAGLGPRHPSGGGPGPKRQRRCVKIARARRSPVSGRPAASHTRVCEHSSSRDSRTPHLKCPCREPCALKYRFQIDSFPSQPARWLLRAAAALPVDDRRRSGRSATVPTLALGSCKPFDPGLPNRCLPATARLGGRRAPGIGGAPTPGWVFSVSRPPVPCLGHRGGARLQRRRLRTRG